MNQCIATHKRAAHTRLWVVVVNGRQIGEPTTRANAEWWANRIRDMGHFALAAPINAGPERHLARRAGGDR